LTSFASSGSSSATLPFLGALAEGLARGGQGAEALAAIEETLVLSEHDEGCWCVAELLRIKGELVQLEGGPDPVEAAEDHFRQALDWARRQGALSWELRAATSLARLWRNQNRTRAAREILAPVYDRFTEGFETTDLKAANCCSMVYASRDANTSVSLLLRFRFVQALAASPKYVRVFKCLCRGLCPSFEASYLGPPRAR
jgi:predicted ATPase